jgi:hypothetical protein
LNELLQRDKELISSRLRFDWNIEDNKTVEDTFLELTRLQCGYAAGGASAVTQLIVINQAARDIITAMRDGTLDSPTGFALLRNLRDALPP